MKRLSLVGAAGARRSSLAVSCGGQAPRGPTPVKLMLDWVPNTNHTGIYVAQGQGLFRGGRA